MITTQVGYRADSFPTDFFPTVSQIPPLRAHTHMCRHSGPKHTKQARALCALIRAREVCCWGERERKETCQEIPLLKLSMHSSLSLVRAAGHFPRIYFFSLLSSHDETDRPAQSRHSLIQPKRKNR